MEQPASPDNQPEAPPAPSSLVGRLLNVFAAPGEVFDEIAGRPVETANWLAPALLLIAVSWLGVWLVFSQASIRHQLSDITDQAIQKQAQSQHMNEQQMEQARQVGEKWAGIFAIIGALVLPLFVAFLSPFIWGFILWVVGDKVLNGGFAYMKAVEVAGLANMIAVLEAVARTLLIVATGNFYASTSPAMLIKNFDPQNMVHTGLLYLNVMMFWLLAVRAGGLARLARTSFVKAAIWVFGIWITYNGFFFGLSLASQALMKRMAHH